MTLKTIADEVGVSVTTVTRALRDGHRIGAATVEKVRAAAERLGYVRNLDGLKLRTGQTFVIMAMLGFTNEEEVGDSGSVGLLNGLHTRFSETEYSVRTIPITIGDSGMYRLREVVRGRNADGLVLDHTELEDERVQFLLENDVPFVTFGRTSLSERHAYLDIDNEHAAWQGTSALVNAGYQRIALLDADPRFVFVKQRLEGYRRALAENGLDFDPSLVEHLSLEADVARERAGKLTRDGIDAFVCVNELVFLGARAGARRALGAEARDLGFSFRSGTNIGEYIGTPVHASYFSRVQAGWTLADLLLRRMDGVPVQSCQKIVQTELRIHSGIPS